MRNRITAFRPISFEPLGERLSLSSVALSATVGAPTAYQSVLPSAGPVEPVPVPPPFVDDPPITQPDLPPSGPVGPGTSS